VDSGSEKKNSTHFKVVSRTAVFVAIVSLVVLFVAPLTQGFDGFNLVLILSIISTVVAAGVLFYLSSLVSHLTKAKDNKAEGLSVAATEMAEGKFNVNLREVSDGEFSDVEEALAHLAQVNKDLVRDVEAVCKLHAQGETGALIDVTLYKGEYRRLLEEVNALISDYAGTLSGVAQMASAISSGDLNVEAPRLSGKKSAPSDALSELKTGLSAVLKDMKDSISAARGGSPLRDASIPSYKGLSRTLAEALSELNTAAADAVEAAKSVAPSAAVSSSHGSASDADLSRFSNVAADIKIVADAISKDASDISDNNRKLSQEINHQYSLAQDLHNTLAEVSTHAEETAEKADRAAKLASAAMENTGVGQTEMSNMLSAIDGIGKSSENIARIIKAIDDIAMQTNLLALNAAVEAARAGVHGKGFMVVAEEVRSLANKSKEAANQTTELIQESMQQVSRGTDTAQNTARALEQVVSDVHEINQIVGRIADVAGGQRDAITKVANGADQLTANARYSTDTIDGTIMATHDLETQIGDLHKLVSSASSGSDSGSYSSVRSSAHRPTPPERRPVPPPVVRSEPPKAKPPAQAVKPAAPAKAPVQTTKPAPPSPTKPAEEAPAAKPAEPASAPAAAPKPATPPSAAATAPKPAATATPTKTKLAAVPKPLTASKPVTPTATTPKPTVTAPKPSAPATTAPKPTAPATTTPKPSAPAATAPKPATPAATAPKPPPPAPMPKPAPTPAPIPTKPATLQSDTPPTKTRRTPAGDKTSAGKSVKINAPSGSHEYDRRDFGKY